MFVFDDGLSETITNASIDDFFVELGIVVDVVDVVVEHDENGRVTSVVVSIVGDKETALLVVNTVNNAIDSGSCTNGFVLCRATGVFVEDNGSMPVSCVKDKMCPLLFVSMVLLCLF